MDTTTPAGPETRQTRTRNTDARAYYGGSVLNEI